MDVSANGKLRTVAEDASLEELLQALRLDAARVVVERNRVIVPREEFAAVTLAEGNALEIVHFVGGG